MDEERFSANSDTKDIWPQKLCKNHLNITVENQANLKNVKMLCVYVHAWSGRIQTESSVWIVLFNIKNI